MAQFKAIDPNVEVNGETVLSIVDGMGMFKSKALEILAKNGINDPKPGEWYPQQSWLNAFKEISEKLGDATLYKIGTKIPENAQWPPEVDNIEKALASIDIAYHMNHRNGDIGSYTFIRTGERSAKMECPNPYPCEFDRGIIAGIAEKFKPSDSVVTVEHDPNSTCRKKGDDSCFCLISW